jgi:hypothetical protein
VAEGGLVNGRNVAYQYDNDYRLTAEIISGDPSQNGTISYTYDPGGNQTQRNSSVPAIPATGTLTYDANDRTSTDPYDANGNLLNSGTGSSNETCQVMQGPKSTATALQIVYSGLEGISIIIMAHTFMAEQYTQRVRDLLVSAEREAIRAGSPFVGLEHLALVLLWDLSHDILSDVDVPSLQTRIKEYLSQQEKVRTTNEVPLSDEVNQALLFASEEAKRLNDSWIRIPHLLLGLMRVEDSYATRLLRENGVSLEGLRNKIAPASVIGSGKKWNDVYETATNLSKHGFTIPVIKEWREEAAAKGQPSGLQDFYRTHGICWDCQCTGLRITGFDEKTEEHLWSICATCGGTGRLPDGDPS